MSPVEAAGQELARRSRAAQGLPAVVEDPAAIARVAALIAPVPVAGRARKQKAEPPLRPRSSAGEAEGRRERPHTPTAR